MWWILGGAALLLILSGSERERDLIVPVPGIDINGNARRIKEGYLLSGMITAENVPRIRQEGIRVVLSAADPGDPVRVALARSGIEWVPVYLGSHWRHTGILADVASRYEPEQILIHCQHGVDRTGNITAHYLVSRHGWEIAPALLAMVYPTEEDVEGLNEVLRMHGLPHQAELGGPGIGMYSLAGIGRRGGMKARNEAYQRLISGNIEALGAQIIN